VLHQAHKTKIAELEAAHARTLEEKDEIIAYERKWVEEYNYYQEVSFLYTFPKWNNEFRH
jgi:hypothetical protein